MNAGALRRMCSARRNSNSSQRSPTHQPWWRQARGWSPGVVGVVASRLVERYHRPAIVIGIEDGAGKGSGRSIKGFDLGEAVIAARQEGPPDPRRRSSHGRRHEYQCREDPGVQRLPSMTE